MSARRVLYVIAQLGAGGTERQLLHLVQRLDRSRFTPEVATFTSGGALEADFRAACPVHVLPKRAATEAAVMISLIRLIRRLRPAVVHTCLYPANWRGALASRLCGVPAIVGSVRNLSTWMGPVSRAVERAATRWADAVIVNASAVARFMVEEVGARQDRLRVIPNGVDLDLYHPKSEGAGRPGRELWAGEAAPEVVGAVMSLTPKKNPALLVEAARRAVAKRPQARFLVAGEGPLREELESRIASAGLTGRFLLAGLRRDIPDLLRSIDLLALTSDREGLPNVVLEAMATGLPVVATAAGGTPELVVEGVTGRLVPAGDPEALALAILDVLSVPGAARRMGEAGLRLARQEYGLGRMIERTEALYADLLSLQPAAVSRSVAAAPAAEGRE